jgi:hypothetical protein
MRKKSLFRKRCPNDNESFFPEEFRVEANAGCNNGRTVTIAKKNNALKLICLIISLLQFGKIEFFPIWEF